MWSKQSTLKKSCVIVTLWCGKILMTPFAHFEVFLTKQDDQTYFGILLALRPALGISTWMSTIPYTPYPTLHGYVNPHLSYPSLPYPISSYLKRVNPCSTLPYPTLPYTTYLWYILHTLLDGRVNPYPTLTYPTLPYPTLRICSPYVDS